MSKTVSSKRKSPSTKKRAAKKSSAKKRKVAKASAGMSDDAIKAKTGRTWPEWRKALDALGAAKLDHTALAEIVRQKFKLPGWWAQSVTVGYERLIGKRTVNQTSGGFSASISKTCAASAKKLFDVLDDAGSHKKVFGQRVLFSTRTAAKTLRFKWDETERVVIAFYEKTKEKAQVVVQHEKLATAKDVERVKKFWRDVLEKVEDIAVP